MDSLLAMLSDTQPVSGEVLCQRLGMTRGAVWKRMEKLRQEGYQITACGKLGYRLDMAEDSLLPGYIEKEAGTRWAAQSRIEYAPAMESTNTTAKELARDGAPHGTLVICNHQTAGRGRLQRAWETPMGTALTQSLVLRPSLSIEQAQLCTLAAAVATAQAIQQVCPGLTPGIKWPNDVVIGKRKCVGILSELSADMDGITYVIPGVGVNVNQTEFPQELAEKATSLLIELRRQDPTARPVCRRKLLCAYLRHMEDAVDALQENGFDGICQEYLARSVTLGQQVHVMGANIDFVGMAQSIDNTGALLVEDQAGELRRVLCGDVSVRGMMGYC